MSTFDESTGLVAPIAKTHQRGRGFDGHWALVWQKFRRHRLGVAGGIGVIFAFILAACREFFATVVLAACKPSYM